ncbi:MAG: ABC transporter permease, partial [Bacteroidetes bacterium]|nr:ABC transporter permease [Bacteroidota bacterium]
MLEETVTPSAFKIAGIYYTGLQDFDEQYVIGDIAHIQKLNKNKWEKDEVAGFELLIDDFNKIEELTNFVYSNIDASLYAESIIEKFPQLFDWLSLLDTNVYIILLLMVIVAAINMISTLLILILEKTNMIGILKSLGTNNWSVRKIFLY